MRWCEIITEARQWKLHEFGTGRVVNGVNTTVDVGPGEIKKQAAKFGFKVSDDGVPETILEGLVDLEGFWIDEHGNLIECDHKRDYHHSDIALEAFPQDEDEDDDEFDAGDRAIAEAEGSGWVRGSYVIGKELVLSWDTMFQKPTPHAAKTLLDWLVEHGTRFPFYRVVIDGSEKVFSDSPDFSGVMKYVERALR